jgi:hypothetical protein
VGGKNKRERERQREREIPTQTKTKVQDLIHNYHTFCVVFIKLCQTMGAAASWILDQRHATCTFFFYFDLKGYANSQVSEKVGS